MAAETPDNRQRLKCTPQALRQVLDQLDQPESASGTGRNKRSERRHSYRAHDVTVELRGTGAPARRYAVSTRNLSANGMSFIVGHFVYPGTIVRSQLVTLNGQKTEQGGKVTRCSYVNGTGNLHEVGVQFDTPVELGMFQRHLPLRMLLADPDPASPRRAANALQGQCDTLIHVVGGLEAARRLATDRFDLALLALDLPESGGVALAGELRSRGCAGPLAALLDQVTPEQQRACLVAGFDFVCDRPLRRETLLALVESSRAEPAFSRLIQEPGMVPNIDEFVASLPQRMARMQTLLAKKETANLARLVREVRVDAGEAGFDSIVEAAGGLEKALEAGAEPADLRAPMTELMRNCRGARGASCAATPAGAASVSEGGAAPAAAPEVAVAAPNGSLKAATAPAGS